jgi:hypothetical protein
VKLKDFIIIALAFVIIYLCTCNRPETIVETKTVTRVDSLYFRDTIVQTIKIPKTELIYVNAIQPERLDLSDTNVFYSTYVYEHRDSVLEATISIEANERPLKAELEYNFKQFTLKDSVYVRDSVYQEAVKSFMSVGATLVGSKNSFGFCPQLQYNHKKGNTYSVGYDLINGNFHVGFTKKLSFKK